jgi:hypothetical protein
MDENNKKAVKAEVNEMPVENGGENPVQPTVETKEHFTRKLGEWLIKKTDLYEMKRAAKKAEKDRAKAEGRLTKGQKIGIGLGIGAGIVGTIVAKEFVRAAMSAPDEEEETYTTDGEEIDTGITDEIVSEETTD